MKPKWLIIHHTATKRDTTTFEAVKKNHINQGWGDIGYHKFITPNAVFEGRAEDLVGAHCKADDMNFKSLGICLTGNFQNETPTQFQLDKLTELVEELCKKYAIPRENILGHREVKGASTACPGDNLLPFVKELRATSIKRYTEEEMTDMRLQRDGNWNKYQSCLEELENAKKDNEELKSKVANLKDQISSLNEAMAKVAEEDRDSAVAELEMSQKLEDCKKDLENAVKQILELKEGIKVAKESEKALREALVAKSASDLTLRELLKEIWGRILGRR